MNGWINLDALFKIIFVGLLTGAGLPAVFAVGLRSLVMPSGGATTSDNHAKGGGALGLAIGVACFTVVLVAIGMGIYLIVTA